MKKKIYLSFFGVLFAIGIAFTLNLRQESLVSNNFTLQNAEVLAFAECSDSSKRDGVPMTGKCNTPVSLEKPKDKCSTSIITCQGSKTCNCQPRGCSIHD